MRQSWIVALMGVSLITPVMSGCDKTKSEEKTVTKNPDTGAETTTKKKVAATQGGGEKVTEEKKTVNP